MDKNLLETEMSSFIKLLLYVELTVITVCGLFKVAGANSMSFGSLLLLTAFTLALVAASFAYTCGVSYYAAFATICLSFGSLTLAFSYKLNAAIAEMSVYGNAKDALESRSVISLVLAIAAIAGFAMLSRGAIKETGIKTMWSLGIHALAAATILAAIAWPPEPYTTSVAVAGCTCILLLGAFGRKYAMACPQPT